MDKQKLKLYAGFQDLNIQIYHNNSTSNNK